MKVIVIGGPTACGKSQMALLLAKEIGADIISADSRQIYKGMDIGSGKVDGKIDPDILCDGINPFISSGVNHWMIDIIEPDENYSVCDYQKKVYSLIGELEKQNKKVIIAGGTGLYIRSVVDGLVFTDVKVSEETRNAVRGMTLEELQKEISKRCENPEEFVDMKNPRRLMRALELLMSGLSGLDELKKVNPPDIDFLVLGITFDRDTINERIKLRLDDRLKNGMIDEMKKLLEYVSYERLDSFGLEYRYVTRYVKGYITYNQMYDSLYTEIKRFAKRQMTWFRKYGNVTWVNDFDKVFLLAKNFYSK